MGVPLASTIEKASDIWASDKPEERRLSEQAQTAQTNGLP
jgi:hypothetical protein